MNSACGRLSRRAGAWPEPEPEPCCIQDSVTATEVAADAVIVMSSAPMFLEMWFCSSAAAVNKTVSATSSAAAEGPVERVVDPTLPADAGNIIVGRVCADGGKGCVPAPPLTLRLWLWLKFRLWL